MSQGFKKGLISAAAFMTLLFSAGESQALHTLQLDISGGSYDLATETIVAPSDSFTLYAFLIPDRYNLLSDSYFISAAVSPKVGPPGSNLGSFKFNNNTVQVTSGMTYGVPPLEDIVSKQGWDSGDLSKHGIYPTYFSEFQVNFSSANQIAGYNTQDRAISGGAINTSINSSGGMYFAAFTVDTSMLNSGYSLHFDLYNTKLKSGGDVDVSQFAPFSHDAESTSRHQVPEPSTMMLMFACSPGAILLRSLIIRRQSLKS